MGSVTPYDTANGRRYRARWWTPERKQAEKGGFRTKKAAELHIAKVEVSKASGTYFDPQSAKATIGDLAPVWLSAQRHLKPSTLDPIERTWRVYVEPRWADTRLSAVVNSDVQAWVNAIVDGTAPSTRSTTGPRSATVAIRAYGILAGIIDSAVKDNRIPKNHARGIALPRKGRKARAYLDHEQVELLASHAGAHATLVRTLAYTGLRWGEAVALRVEDWNPLRRRLHVRQNTVKVAGKLVTGTPKTHQERSVPYPSFLADQIGEAAHAKARSQLIFGDGTNPLMQSHSTRGWFIAAVRRAQVEDPTFPEHLTPHDLRHTAASLSISAGANVKAIQRMLGHASAAMTLDTYADLFDDDLDLVAEKLEQHRAERVGKMWGKRPIAELPTPELPQDSAGVGA